jgi:apolipoprotein N-acyltransferase
MALVGPAPFLWVVRRARPSSGALFGLTFGFVFFGATLYWIWLFGALAWSALTIVLSLWTAAFGFLAPSVWNDERPAVSILALCGMWTAIEWLRGMWPLGGFTWGSLGVSQVGDRTLLHLASVGGVWLVTFAVIWVNLLLVVAIEQRSARRAILPIVLATAIVLAPVIIPLPAADGRPIDIAAVQVDVRRAQGSPSEVDRAVARLNISQSSALSSNPPDLMVWGEGALDPGATSDPVTYTAVRAAIARIGAPALVGAVVNSIGRQYTEALLFDAGGTLVGQYRKTHLVPFGEYVPWRSELSFISALKQVPVDRTPGTSIQPMSVGGLPPFGTPICFENSFPSIDRAFVRAGATFLVITTDDASYRMTAASAQQVQMSQMRAVEDGRWIVHDAVSGESAMIDPTGRIVGRTNLFEPAILRRTIRSSDELTWYVRLGDWVPLVSLVFVIVALSSPRKRRRNRRDPAPLGPSPRTLVILPTFNERDTIEQVVHELLALGERVDILVVDDSSPDGTGALVEAIARHEPRVRLIERPVKSGLGSAYLLGFRTALEDGYDLVVEMDSDLSHRPAQLSGLLAAAGSHDMVVGSRYVPGGSVTNWGLLRVGLSRAGNAYARFMLDLPLRDATSGFRVYRRPLLEELTRRPFTSDGYGFQIELAWRAGRLGYDLHEEPITFQERQHGVSKISRTIVLEALWLVTRWGLKSRFGGGEPLTASQAERP